jgi:hypothetical protein
VLAPVLARYPDGARFDSDAFFLAAGEAGIEGVALCHRSAGRLGRRAAAV